MLLANKAHQGQTPDYKQLRMYKPEMPYMIVYHNDHLGTPQKMTDTSGAVVWSATYDAFGKATVDAGSTVVNNLRFPGQYYDAETGLHYNWNRYYNPETGRYLIEDPIRFSSLKIFAQNSLKNLYRSLPNSQDTQRLFISYRLYLYLIENSQTSNMYLYSLNGPENFIDPYGLQRGLLPGISGGVGHGIGGAAGAAVGGALGAAAGVDIGMDIGFAIGASLGLGGGPLGSFGGGLVGGAVGGVVGGLIGGFGGGSIGGAIGGMFDNPCAGKLNCDEPPIPDPCKK